MKTLMLILWTVVAVVAVNGWTAAGHDAIHRDLPHGRGKSRRRQKSDDLLRRTIGKRKKGVDLLERRWNDRQSVGPHALLKVIVHLKKVGFEDDGAWHRRIRALVFLFSNWRMRQQRDKLVDQRQ